MSHKDRRHSARCHEGRGGSHAVRSAVRGYRRGEAVASTGCRCRDIPFFWSRA